MLYKEMHRHSTYVYFVKFDAGSSLAAQRTLPLHSGSGRIMKLYAAAGEAPTMDDENTTLEEDLMRIRKMMQDMGMQLNEEEEEESNGPFDYDAALNAAEPMT